MDTQMLIGSRFEAGTETEEQVLDPRTGALIKAIPEASQAQIDAAVSAADTAFATWSRTTPAQRSGYLLRIAQAIEDDAEAFAALEALNCGKPINAVRNDEIPAIVDCWRFFAGAVRNMHSTVAGEYLPGHTSMIRRDPIGIVASIAPWNYPLMMMAWKLAPAIAGGNTVVFKPSEQTPLTALKLAKVMADILPEGVVNDRWAHAKFATKLLRRKTVRRVADYLARRYIDKHPEAVNGVVPQAVPHSDFRTPEYTTFKTIQKRKWEATRGMSHSFGFNRNDREEDYAPGETLLADFIDAVAKGGNLLLNVGPRGSDAQIPAAQLARLKLFGAWLAENGHAIYGTRPWQGRGDTPEAETACGLPVRFTQSGDTVHLIVLGKPEGNRLVIRNLALSGSARVSDGAPVTLETDGPDLVLNFGKPLDGRFAPVISIETGIIAR